MILGSSSLRMKELCQGNLKADGVVRISLQNQLLRVRKLSLANYLEVQGSLEDHYMVYIEWYREIRYRVYGTWYILLQVQGS